MKLSKIALLILVVLVSLSVMTSCRCVPSDVEWCLQYYKMDYTFMGGVVKPVNFSDISVTYPFAKAKKDVIDLSFFDDGTVSFTTCDGETLTGTFTYSHEGMNYTKFTITFDNGEVVTGDSGSYLGSDFLNFTYAGVFYNFTDKDLISDNDINGVVYLIRENRATTLSQANIVMTAEGYELQIKDGDPVAITAESTVYAARITSNNEFVPLDEILEGECLAEHIAELDYTVIYYVEPIEK